MDLIEKSDDEVSVPLDGTSSFIGHFFRHEAGRIVSLLSKIFGINNLQLSEDMVQETMLEAFQHWSYGSIPENPSAWVMTVAKRKVLNHLKRSHFLNTHEDSIAYHYYAPEEIEELFQESNIRDSMLRMFFVCAHPSIPTEARVILTLKILCGFSTLEISNALLSNQVSIEKKIYRAKLEFKNKNLPLEIPKGSDFEARIQCVHTCIYLLFNEGYNSSHPDFLIRKDLCAEAMRLGKLVIKQFPHERGSLALMSLMCFHAARLNSRIDDKGAIVIFHKQDRSLWNRQLIDLGHSYLAEASQGEVITEYHVEAAIAAEHCTAKDFSSTRWKNIDQYYSVLEEMKWSPIIGLNRAIILSQTNGPEVAIKKLLQLKQNEKLKNYYLLHATLGELYSQTENYALAQEHFILAISLTSSKTEQNFLRDKLNVISEQN